MSESDIGQRLKHLIAERDALRGRPLTEREKLMNLTAALGECDSDCITQQGCLTCTCGAREFKAKFGPGKHTP